MGVTGPVFPAVLFVHLYLAPAEKRALKSIYGKLYTSRIDPVSFGIMAGHVRGCLDLDRSLNCPEGDCPT